MTNVKNKEEK